MVQVAFLHVGADLELPQIMVRSVRDAMPGVKVIQMTDEETPQIEGVDEAWRGSLRGKKIKILDRFIPEKLMVFRMKMLAQLGDEETIVLDTDCVVQKDVRVIFNDPFDICLTRRAVVIDPDGLNIADYMPYNTGVMFSRSSRFWQDCYAAVRQMPPEVKDWFGDQAAVRNVCRRYKLKEVDVDPWNYSPRTQDEDVSDKYVVHYKGLRKAWMLVNGRKGH